MYETESDKDMEIEIETESEQESENYDIIRAKWSFDGCTTLQEVIEKCEILKNHYTKLIEEGWQLESAIEDDYGHIRRR